MRFQQNPLWVRSARAAVFVFLRGTSLAIRGYRRGTITTLNLLAPVQSCFSKLLAAGTLRYPSKIAPCLVCASSRTVLFPDAEQRQGEASSNPRVGLRGRLI